MFKFFRVSIEYFEKISGQLSDFSLFLSLFSIPLLYAAASSHRAGHSSTRAAAPLPRCAAPSRPLLEHAARLAVADAPLSPRTSRPDGRSTTAASGRPHLALPSPLTRLDHSRELRAVLTLPTFLPEHERRVPFAPLPENGRRRHHGRRPLLGRRGAPSSTHPRTKPTPQRAPLTPTGAP